MDHLAAATAAFFTADTLFMPLLVVGAFLVALWVFTWFVAVGGHDTFSVYGSPVLVAIGVACGAGAAAVTRMHEWGAILAASAAIVAATVVWCGTWWILERRRAVSVRRS